WNGAHPRICGHAVLRSDVESLYVHLRLQDAVRDGAVAAQSGGIEHLVMHIFKNTNFDFLKYRWPAIAVSWVIILAGAFAIWTKGIPKGVEFAGGTVVITQFDQPTSVQQVRAALDKTFPGGDTVVQSYGDPQQNQVMVRVPTTGQEAGSSLSKTQDQIKA